MLAVPLGLLAARRLQLRWGATAAEAADPLPGDDLLPGTDLVATRAISIAAPPEAVWPWLAQLGQGRGGFYSYDRLENLAGCEVHSVDHIVEAWQGLAVGDDVHLHPAVALRVVRVEAPHALVLAGGAPAGQPDGAPYDFTWAFVVQPTSPGRSRLVVRERYAYRAPWTALVVEPLALVSFVMTQRMLRGVRDRATVAPTSR